MTLIILLETGIIGKYIQLIDYDGVMSISHVKDRVISADCWKVTFRSVAP